MNLQMICIDRSYYSLPGHLASGKLYRVGRSSDCDFVLKDKSVSRYHAEVTVNEDRIFVKDLGSRNGTFVEDCRIEEAEVLPTQSVRFGNAQFQLIGYGDQPPSRDDSMAPTFVVNSTGTAAAALKQLSDAQRRVLDLLLEGKSEKEVASKLRISQHTVHNHVKKIYLKMSVNSRPELLALFVTEERPVAGRK